MEPSDGDSCSRPRQGSSPAPLLLVLDDSRATTVLLVIGAAMVSLVGVALAMVKAKDQSGTLVVLLTSAGVATVALSWGLVHTIFVLRYAHLYYRSPEGGVDFPSENEPDFLDFAELAFTIGMTFQVSDTDLQARAFAGRRFVTR